MTQSTEYPDLKWMPPKAFGTGRDGKAVRYIVIHYTAGAERNTSAEDGAVYDQNRTDGTSTHYFVDSNSVVQCVLTKNRGNAARTKGNRLGIQYELCGTVQTRAQWLDAASLPTLKNAARQVARDCKKYGIPVRRLSVAETRRAWDEFPAGPRGIVGHVDCTNAYPEDGGDHTDPGTQFPWDVFLDLVQAELTPKEPDVNLTDKVGSKAYPARTVGNVLNDLEGLRDTLIGDATGTKAAAVKAGSPVGKLMAMPAQLDTIGKALLAAVAASKGADVDEDAIAAGVLAGLTPEKIAAWIPEGVAQEVVDLLAARLQS
jgi:hypothetical protein